MCCLENVYTALHVSKLRSCVACTASSLKVSEFVMDIIQFYLNNRIRCRKRRKEILKVELVESDRNKKRAQHLITNSTVVRICARHNQMMVRKETLQTFFECSFVVRFYL